MVLRDRLTTWRCLPQLRSFLRSTSVDVTRKALTPEVAARLKEITVDVKTVTLPMKAEATASSDPKPAVDLTAGASNRKATIAMGSTNIPLTMKTEIKEQGNSWILTETAQTPQGELSDVSTVDKGTLQLTHRTINQGPVVIDIDFKGNKAKGTMTMNGQSQPIDADLGGAIFADGGGAFEVMAALPLAPGYAVNFRNFDVQKQKAQLKQLKVVGAESVTVPGGTFDTYKVEIVSADNEAEKMTVWIAKDSRKVVKISAVLTALNGAILTSELVN